MTGAYFSAVGAGAVAWSAAAAGRTVDEIAGVLAEQFSIEPAAARADAAAFVEALLAEDLLVAGADAPAAVAVVATSREYAAPTLEKYTDLSDLILLDPVHDVSEAGWPQPQANP